MKFESKCKTFHSFIHVFEAVLSRGRWVKNDNTTRTNQNTPVYLMGYAVNIFFTNDFLVESLSTTTLPEKVLEYLESIMKTLAFDIWFAGNGLSPTTKNVVTSIQLLRVKNGMRNLRYQRYLIGCTGMYHFFYTEPNISHNFQCINHYILNLWILCVYSISR